MHKALTLALAAAAFGAHAIPAMTPGAVDPIGTWINEDKDGIVQIGDCGMLASAAPSGTLCGNVVWLKTPIDPATGRPQADRHNIDPAHRGRPILGMQVISQMRPSGTPGRWEGRVYDLDSGKTYDGSLIVRSATQMRVQGCQFLICQGEEWMRQAIPDTAAPRSPAAQPRAR
jgi:uncharacterized protein (DUF2147 family)